jgi:dihydroorotase
VRLDQRGIGRLTPGISGDVTVIDPQLSWTIDVADFASAARNCPFDGWKVRGRAVATIVQGRVKQLRRAPASSRV